jgi:low temperature requirement protein LtrA
LSCGVAAALWLLSAFLDAPARFLVWALALTLDIGTPIVTTRHLVDVPHDAAHLPERYGLFSIILIGESMAGVMAGMGHQEYWSARAASAAILGMGAVFAIWWAYFDRVDATAHRMVTTMADARRFHVWSYVHLPLYLGIAVLGVGFERVIETATDAPLPMSEALILAGAAAAVALALGAIGLTHVPRRSA